MKRLILSGTLLGGLLMLTGFQTHTGGGGTGGGAPSGAAGGDLGGTYPNPTVRASHIISGTISGVTTVGQTGQYTNSANGAASTPAALYTGVPFTGGTGTTTVPLFLFQPTGTANSTNWNTAGTVLGVALPTGYTGNFFDFQINGASTIRGNAQGTVIALGGFTTTTHNSSFAGLILNIVTASANLTVANTSDTVLCNAAAGNITLTLSPITNAVFTVKKIDSTANTCTVTAGGVTLIDAATTMVMTNQWEAAEFHYNAVQWFVLNHTGGVSVGPIAGSETIASSTTPVFTATTRASYNVLTASVTSFTLPAGTGGQEKTLTFCQNATGGFTVAAPANVRGFGTVGLNVSQCSSQHFTYVTPVTAWLADGAMVTNE